MSKKYGICCVNCQKPLNNEDDIFGTSCGHLYHFPCIRSNHGKSTECMHCEAYKPMMFKMHLTFDDTPVASKCQELSNKLIEHERINAMLINTNTAARQTIAEYEEEMKALKDILQAKEVTVKELNDRIETMEAYSKYLSKNQAGNFSNKQQSNSNYYLRKEFYNGNNKGDGGGSSHYYNKKVESTTNTLGMITRYQNANDHQEVAANAGSSSSNGHNTAIKEKQDSFEGIQFRNTLTVMITNIKSSDSSTDSALANVIGLAEQMGLTLAPDHVKSICVLNDDPNLLTYVVYFSTKQMKEQFLRNVHVLKQFPETKHLNIF